MYNFNKYQTGNLAKARGREWIITAIYEEPAKSFLLRPLSGNEDESTVIIPQLEVPGSFTDATFPLPPNPQKSTDKKQKIDILASQREADLLTKAMRLSLRRGAGPFRSSGRISVEPRPYQLVPLLMALRLKTVRLLIADEVGIGKTIEAGLIMRELLDREEIRRFSVLCPPNLIEQWIGELKNKFDLNAVAVTSATVKKLERTILGDQNIFDVYPFTVVSFDYIKQDRYKNIYERHAPELLIIDEAHSAVGVAGEQKRYKLLEKLASDEKRHLLLLTATPHSGNVEGWNRLLGLLKPEFAYGRPKDDGQALENYKKQLSLRFIQRRRDDIEKLEEEEKTRTFPTLISKELTYKLKDDFEKFLKDVLDYCQNIATGKEGHKNQHLTYWHLLSLMRCVSSSPQAALSALQNRINNRFAHDGKIIEENVFDDEDEQELSDIEPALSSIEESSSQDKDALKKLINDAQNLIQKSTLDPKYKELLKILKELEDKEGQNNNTIIFCRYISTAKMLGNLLTKKYKTYQILTITGQLTPEERRQKIEAIDLDVPRILVATDCLSEGINLQSYFNAVIHYDLCWNPTRHQQREGRVNRFGQKAENVYSFMLYGENSPIDGAVLTVIIKKAREIENETDVRVPLPSDRASLGEVLMSATLLKKKAMENENQKEMFAKQEMGPVNRLWAARDAEAKAHRASRFAQMSYNDGKAGEENSEKPLQKALRYWKENREIFGGPEDVKLFIKVSLGVAIEGTKDKDVFKLHLDAIDNKQCKLLLDDIFPKSSKNQKRLYRINFDDTPRANTYHIGRMHPLTSALATTIAEEALIKQKRRIGAWYLPIPKKIMIALLRLRFYIKKHGKARPILAEEIIMLPLHKAETGWAIGGGDLAQSVAKNLLNKTGETIEGGKRDAFCAQALKDIEEDDVKDLFQTYMAQRAEKLKKDHEDVQDLQKTERTQITVDPAGTVDVIGLYILAPTENR